MIVLLNNVRSIHNIGSIFRTADGAGVEKLYLCGVTPSPVDVFGKYRPQISKVALGAEKVVPWEKVRSATVLIKKLKREKYKVFAVEQAKNSILYSALPKSYILYPKFCLVLGAEVTGLPPSILKLCDKILEIPMHGKKESLNVSVAAGIVMYELAKQKKM